MVIFELVFLLYFLKLSVGNQFCKIHRKTPQPATLLKKRLWHRYFPVNFAKFLRTPFLKEHIWWLLLCITRKGKQGEIVIDKEG